MKKSVIARFFLWRYLWSILHQLKKENNILAYLVSGVVNVH